MAGPYAPEFFNRDSFEISARKNVEHAVERLSREAAMHRAEHKRTGAHGDLMLALRDEESAATLRELLDPASVYFKAA